MDKTGWENPDPDSIFILGSGEMSGRVRAFDWSKTPLGPIHRWPQSLRTVVNIVLSSRYSMWMAWGRELTFLCNDAYRPTLGLKDSWALGAPATEVWSEIWREIGPRIESVLTSGEATYDEGLLLFLERSGFPEETYHTFSYSPLTDESTHISGMLCVVTEETERVIGERRVITMRDVASELGRAKTEQDVLAALGQSLERNRKDLPFTLLYLFNEDGAGCLASSSGIARTHPLAMDEIPKDAVYPWPGRDVQAGLSRVIEDLSARVQAAPLPQGDWAKPVEQAAVVGLRQPGQNRLAGFMVVGLSPYRRYDEAYSGFLDLLAGQIGAAIGGARAYDGERRRAEALAELDRTKTTFFSNVSHEFRTPLTLMLGPLEELIGSSSTPPEHRDLAKVAHRNSLRLLKLVNTLLDFSRIEAGRIEARYEPVDLAELTADIAANFRSATQRVGLELRVACESLPQPVYVDREMWEKVVLNLISNAFKFTFEGAISVELGAADDAAELKVRDTGTGIPAAELPRLFDRFHRVDGSRGRTHEGSGIGLALVQELVKTHRGSVSVESELGRGSTFTVRIPFGKRHLPENCIRTDPAGRATGTRADAYVLEALRWLPSDGAGDVPPLLDTDRPGFPAELLANGRRPRVLLAEDNLDMREYVKRLLGPMFDITAVTNGREALDAVLADPPDLILSDVMMPALDGFELLRHLRADPKTNTLPVILLSARAGEESRVEGVSAGADDYLTKPFSARELIARVTAHMRISELRRQAGAALRESEERLRLFIENAPAAIAMFDRDMRYLAASRRWSQDYKIEGDPAGPCHYDLFPDTPERWREAHRRGLAGEILSADNEPFVQPDGSVQRLRWEILPWNRGDGQAGGILIAVEDITRRALEQEALRESEERLRRVNSDLEQFAYSAGHDLREPLRNVSIFSQLLQRKLGKSGDPETAGFLGVLVESTARMEALLRDLLAYTQITPDSGDPEWTDTNAAFRGALDSLKQTIAEAGAVIDSAELPPLRVDAIHLHQLFQNLIGNAIKYRDPERSPRVRVTVDRQGPQWRLGIHDNGIGIAPEYHKQIFGIFKRLHSPSRYPGTGIGLAIALRIVERYAGQIWVESEAGRGSSFYFTLPAE